MTKKDRNNGKKQNQKSGRSVLLSAAALMLLAAGCSGGRGEKETATAEAEMQMIEIAQEDAAETSRIIAANRGREILPTLENVTTDADNAVLAPAYLRMGDSHNVVQILQQRLMLLGFMDNDEPTVFYGDATADAIKKFQRQNGMQQDGICGTDTWDRLFSENAAYYKVRKGDEGSDILEIQQRLYQLGYLADNSGTGHFGEATETAVKKLQERNSIRVDGTAGKETINLLYSDEVKANLIGIGEKSDLVLKYQKKLIELGYLRKEADGNFGSATQSALREFQSRNDLVVDGYLGPGTREAMDSGSAKPFGLRVGDRSESVTEAQRRLCHYGYLQEKHVTGYFGSLTEAAVKKFQQYNGLTKDGTVGRQTMAKLLSSNAVKKPANVTIQASGSTEAGGGTSSAAEQSGKAIENVGGGAGTLLSVASGKLGCRYVWGSKGPKTFDCSGFVYYCLNQAGVGQSYLTSSGWRNPGRYRKITDFDSIQAGDIIVVSGHVGIAAGNGTVIDASSSNGKVVHRNLSSWWRNNFYMAWRIFE